jgi:hypothetical protein
VGAMRMGKLHLHPKCCHWVRLNHACTRGWSGFDWSMLVWKWWWFIYRIEDLTCGWLRLDMISGRAIGTFLLAGMNLQCSVAPPKDHDARQYGGRQLSSQW